MHTVGDHQRLVDHAAAVADLLDLGVEEQVRVAALQRPRPERVDVLIQRLADAADLALADPQPQALDQLVDPPGRDAADIGLLDDRRAAPARSAGAAPGCSGSSCPGGSWGSAARSHPRGCPTAAPDSRCDASRGPAAGARHARPRSARTPRAPSTPPQTALTASRITSACSSSSTFLTTSSIVILSAPATRRSFRRTVKKSDDHQRRVGRNHVPSDPDLHHATGRDRLERCPKSCCERPACVAVSHGLLVGYPSDRARKETAVKQRQPTLRKVVGEGSKGRTSPVAEPKRASPRPRDVPDGVAGNGRRAPEVPVKTDVAHDR